MHTILRHMKDQNKKVANLKHNQQMEKKKNAQLLEEVRRREDNMTDNAQHLQVSDFILLHEKYLQLVCAFWKGWVVNSVVFTWTTCKVLLHSAFFLMDEYAS